jgi:uncharacterized protein
LDSAGLLALLNVRDSLHTTAVRLWDDFLATRTPLITTSLVLIELGDCLSTSRHRSLAIDLRQQLLRFSQCEIVFATPELAADGWDLYSTRPDKDWGMTDCISMLVAKQRGAAQIFTADHHFEQAGFEILL